MAENSKISWTDHTFNPWWGCVKVSPACDHCYAEGFDRRVNPVRIGGTDEKPEFAAKNWGIDAPRRFFGDKHWNEPLKWNRDALKDFGRPARVFCASMADVFEDRADLHPHRQRLMQLIHSTPNLHWNLLSKRHTEIKRYVGPFGQTGNVRFGVTVENQTYDHRIVDDVSWLSVEPMLGTLSLSAHMGASYGGARWSHVDWVIIGGESGAGAREMKLEWAIDLIEQCKAAGVAVHFKQTGDVLARKLGLKDKSGKDKNEWPAELQIQEFPAAGGEPTA